ncbi:calmin isoform X1 [Bufo gargarizans]|uniref:calmin isoform X1 n=2 Tax=Bufo gargarizans TaxID=30331 RepID=UPI001CF43BB6|nr:calmin isoform X1 [Bufo gargarizans]
MAGHEWDWFQREELIGQISDIRVQNLQVERENVQKRTFTRWMNLHLEKCNPPLEVKDLFLDIQDGRILMALLEVLTGQSLLHEYKSSAHRIFRLNNIAKALKFLEDSNVKLVSIDAAEIADGNPSLVLGLIWNIILFLQIKELTGNLNRMSSSSSLSSLPSGSESDTSHPSTPSTEKSMSVSIRDQRRAIKALLNWVQQRTRKYGVAVQDFASSWKSGLAFLAIIKAIDSSLVDMRKALERSTRENLEDAFSIAKKSLNIPRLLEPEDVMVASPDEHSIMTYVAQFLEHFPELAPDDFTNEEAPLEMTYVRYKDGPTEEEGKIITVSRDEDKGYTVELQTRPLTPPETHDYAEVDISWDDKLSLEKSAKNPFQIPTEKTLRQEIKMEASGFKLDGVLRRLEKSPRSDVTRKIPGGPDVKTINGEGENEGPVDSFNVMNGKNAHPHVASLKSVQPNSNSSFRDANNSESSSPFSSISDKEPNDIFYQTQVDYSQLKPRVTSEIVTSPKTSEDDDAYKYVPHQNSPVDNHTKQLTVFQAYKGNGNDGYVQSSDSEPHGDETDSPHPPKISIIPHDLFYYPHYSVPIADVLQAFSDNCPDSLLEKSFTFDVSSEEQGGDNETLSSGVYLDTESTGSDTSLEESHEMIIGLEDSVLDVNYVKTNSQVINGSIAQGTRDVSSRGFFFGPGYNRTFQDDGTDSSEEEREEEWLRREEFVCKRVDLEDSDDLPEEEDRADKQAAKTEESCLSRDTENESRAYRRGERNAPAQSNFAAYHNVNGEGDQLLGSRKEGLNEVTVPGRLAMSSGRPSSGGQFPDVYYPLIFLWLLFYFLLILPELDMSKVAFFVENE